MLTLRQAHPDWGKHRIADELTKANNWVPVVSPNTVKRILKAAGFWPENGAGKKGAPNTAVRTAEQPGQALNIDLCFVPEQHAAQDKLPAVSGSSGRLIVERTHSPAEAPDWPGLVFAEADLAYDEAMRQYAAATRERLVQRRDSKTPELGTDSDWRRQWDSRAERYRVRQQRQQEDLAWQAAKAAWRNTRQTYQAGPTSRSAAHNKLPIRLRSSSGRPTVNNARQPTSNASRKTWPGISAIAR